MGRPKKIKQELIIEKRSNNYIHTYGGGIFDYLSSSPNKFNIADAAHALSLLNRFAGHTIKPYPVAKHLIICCEVAPIEFKLEALLHDMPEAYICDIPSPLKRLPFMQGYVDYEAQQEELMVKEFKLKGVKPGIVADIDHDMSYLEACAVLNFDKRMWKEPEGMQARLKQYKKESPSVLYDISMDWPTQFCEQKYVELYNKYRRDKQ